MRCTRPACSGGSSGALGLELLAPVRDGSAVATAPASIPQKPQHRHLTSVATAVNRNINVVEVVAHSLGSGVLVSELAPRL